MGAAAAGGNRLSCMFLELSAERSLASYSAAAYSCPTAPLPACRGTWDEATRSQCGWECAKAWFKQWIGAHLDASSAVTGKPFVLDEFGKARCASQRAAAFSSRQLCA